ncbi:MAG: hypothetical protein EOO69_02350 [Moraxellaceae bacterium]|nr:MAG: hypothetical protein EOO69_02350 [Moraxellaceae bacterium]
MNTSKDGIHTYIDKIYQHLEGYPIEILIACENIIHSLFEHNCQTISHLTFGRLFDWSKIDDIDKFKKAVYILVDARINVLEQQFEAYHNLKHRYEGVDSDFIHDVLVSEEYVHPFTHEEITEQEFNDLIIIYFSPTEEFKGKLHVK